MCNGTRNVFSWIILESTERACHRSSLSITLELKKQRLDEGSFPRNLQKTCTASSRSFTVCVKTRQVSCLYVLTRFQELSTNRFSKMFRLTAKAKAPVRNEPTSIHLLALPHALITAVQVMTLGLTRLGSVALIWSKSKHHPYPGSASPLFVISFEKWHICNFRCMYIFVFFSYSVSKEVVGLKPF